MGTICQWYDLNGRNRRNTELESKSVRRRELIISSKQRKHHIILHGQVLEQVTHFNYWSKIIEQIRKRDSETNQRIRKAGRLHWDHLECTTKTGRVWNGIIIPQLKSTELIIGENQLGWLGRMHEMKNGRKPYATYEFMNQSAGREQSRIATTAMRLIHLDPTRYIGLK